MKSKILGSLLLLSAFTMNLSAQETPEKFGGTLNLGVGIGYYGYVDQNVPVLHADFEFDVAKNFTLAPSISFYTYQRNYYWGNTKYAYRDYSYRQTVVPIGVKGTYYFDQLFKAGAKWDFYAAGTLGFAIRKTVWENGYYGETRVDHGASGLFLDAHVGAEYHMNGKVGLFLDLSTGVSTFGLAVHF